MNFLFHTISLTSSGGSRVITNLSNYLAEAGHNVAIVIDRNRIAFPLHKNVKVYHLKSFKLKDVTPKYQGDTQNFQQHIQAKASKKTGKKKLKLRDKYPLIQNINEWKKYLFKLFSFPSKYFVMQKFLSEFKPDKIASHNMYYFLEHYFFYPRDKFSVVLHNSPKQVFIDRTVKSILPRTSFFRKRCCIGVSKGVSNEMLELLPIVADNLKTIYNPIDLLEIKGFANEEIPDFFIKNKYIITVSSLAPGKRIDRTIKAFSQLEDQSLHLVILGNGEEENSLKELSRTLNIENRVIFTGFIENPLPYMKNAELLSFTSGYEGLGLVLVEALACGTPVVSTNCPSGPSEILIDELRDYLVDIKNRSEKDIVDDIAQAMSSILNNKPEIKDEHVRRFDREEIVSQWESLATQNNKPTVPRSGFDK